MGRFASTDATPPSIDGSVALPVVTVPMRRAPVADPQHPGEYQHAASIVIRAGLHKRRRRPGERQQHRFACVDRWPARRPLSGDMTGGVALHAGNVTEGAGKTRSCACDQFANSPFFVNALVGLHVKGP